MKLRYPGEAQSGDEVYQDHRRLILRVRPTVGKCTFYLFYARAYGVDASTVDVEDIGIQTRKRAVYRIPEAVR